MKSSTWLLPTQTKRHHLFLSKNVLRNCRHIGSFVACLSLKNAVSWFSAPMVLDEDLVGVKDLVIVWTLKTEKCKGDSLPSNYSIPRTGVNGGSADSYETSTAPFDTSPHWETVFTSLRDCADFCQSLIRRYMTPVAWQPLHFTLKFFCLNRKQGPHWSGCEWRTLSSRRLSFFQWNSSWVSEFVLANTF